MIKALHRLGHFFAGGLLELGDLSNRIVMLVDVSGRVSLMKRDLAAIMRSYMDKPAACQPPQSR
jgi:hypothetical protein